MSRDDRAVVFDVQRFSLHDGPGIRTTVFFKGCALDCAWCHNPEAVRPGPELLYWAERCVAGCRDCLAVCPESALRDRIDERVDRALCTHCGECATVCPSDALEMAGREMSAEELVAEVLRDRDFQAESGGGLTLSGGEPALHSAFLGRFLPLVRSSGVHVALETAGACPWELLEKLLPYLDLVLYDLKVMRGDEHLRWTGKDNREIHENLGRLLASGIEVEVRMPVVPGVNTETANVRETAEFLNRLGVSAITLLPYNYLWEAKVRSLDTPRRPLGLRPPTPSAYEDLAARFDSFGIAAKV